MEDSVGARVVGWTGGGPLWSPGGWGMRPIHRRANDFWRPTAGDHKGPPNHASPRSPLRMMTGFS